MSAKVEQPAKLRRRSSSGSKKKVKRSASAAKLVTKKSTNAIARSASTSRATESVDSGAGAMSAQATDGALPSVGGAEERSAAPELLVLSATMPLIKRAATLPAKQFTKTIAGASAAGLTSASPPAVSPAHPTRKFVVEANAYHGTFVQSMIAARGPEWKATLRQKERLTAADVAECAFVWFKYEHIDDVVPIPMLSEAIDMATLQDAAVREAYAVWVIPPTETNPMQLSPCSLDFAANLRPRPFSLSAYTKLRHRAPPPPAGSTQRMLHYQTMQLPPNPRVVSCFPNSSAVWRKHRLYRCFKAWCDADPATRGSIRERMPITFPFDLNSSSRDEALQFMRDVSATIGVKNWLAKATGGANGNGIFVSPDPVKVVDYVVAQPKRGSAEGDWWVIQEFLENIPLIGDRRRFQVKLHCLTVATPVGFDLYVHKAQRVQMCQEPFDITNPISFVGNWAQQRTATNLKMDEYVMQLPAVAEKYPKILPCWARMKHIITEAIEAAYLHDREHFRSSVGCFDIMGWDFVIEELPSGEWRPVLLEANHRPGFGSTRKYIERVIEQAVALVMMPAFPDRRMKGTLPARVAEIEEPWEHVRTIVVHPEWHQVTQDPIVRFDPVADEPVAALASHAPSAVQSAGKSVAPLDIVSATCTPPPAAGTPTNSESEPSPGPSPQASPPKVESTRDEPAAVAAVTLPQQPPSIDVATL